MHAKYLWMCETSCCSVYIQNHKHTHTRCVLPVPLHPAGDLQMEQDWCLCVALKCVRAGYSRSSLEHTQVLFFYHSPYVMQRQHPQAWLPIHSLSDGAGLIISSSTVPGDSLLGHCLYATHISSTFHAT